MARKTIKLNASAFGYTNSDQPSTVQSLSGVNSVSLFASSRRMYVRFAAFPSSLARKRIYSAIAVFRLSSGYETSAFMMPSAAGFSPSTLTWNNQPAGASGSSPIESGSIISDSDYTFEQGSEYSTERKSETAAALIRSATGYIYNIGTYTPTLFFRKLSDGTSVPYIQISYDDSVDVVSQVEPTAYPSGSEVDPQTALTFRWQLVKDSTDYHCSNEAWTQANAVLYWKKSTESSYSAVNLSGTTMQYTFPANTFSTSSTIQWYIQATDSDGTTSQSAVRSFTTISTEITPDEFPSGSSVDNRVAQRFSWDFVTSAGGTGYGQRSAALLWRVSGSSSWTRINASGSTKNLTVPAYTFPTGATIEWYLTGTDTGGGTSQSEQKNFRIATAKLTMVNYPSGNSVDFGAILPFSWTIKSAAGDLAQSSAILRWRASTTDPWTEINVSGSSKSLNVPAFTFPSHTTVQWYLEATDASGASHTSSTMSFTTVTPQITPTDSPTSGYADPRNAITFSWIFSTGGNNYPQSSATLYWRTAGSSTWTSVAASGSTQSVTIAANTFPLLSNIEWYLEGTDIGGSTTQTEVYTFSTTASTATAVCQEPVGRAEDGTKPITLRWTVQNEDGSEPTRVIVAWKLPSESQFDWHTLIDSAAPIYSLTVPPRTFSAGPVDWRVIAYNRDDVAGPASSASFVVIDAPDAPTGLSATNVPITTISWQSSGQQAYEISIDGAIVETAFGESEYQYKVTEPLEDGVHTISVRILGVYGLWSNPAETQILVENTPDGSIILDGLFHQDASLVWTYTGTAAPETTAVYRDGKWIGTATGAESFLDRFVLGAHEYRVEYWYADGTYTRSNTIAGVMSCQTYLIADLQGGDWTALKLSERDVREVELKRTLSSSLRHVTGSAFPVLELSSFETFSGTFDCAFRTASEARNLERHFGRPVILKAPGEVVLIGALTDVQKTVNPFYISYTFSLDQISWEDFVNDDSNS